MNKRTPGIFAAPSRAKWLNKADVDEWWTGYAFAVVAIAGSWFTALAAGAAAWAAVSLLLGRFDIDIPKPALPLVLSCIALGSWAIFVGSYHDGLPGLWKGLLFAIPLFSLPLLISRFRASDPVQSFNAMSSYAPIGLALAIVFAISQYMLRQPIEGGSGNSYIFGFVIATLSIFSIDTKEIDQLKLIIANYFILSFSLLILYLGAVRTHFLILLALIIFRLIVQFRTRLKKAKITVFSVLILLVFLIFNPLFLGVLSETFEGDGVGQPQSFGVRLEMWKAAFAKLPDVAFLGTGFASKMPEVVNLLPDHLSYLPFTHLHNIFIDAAVSMGLPGFFMVTAVMISTFVMMSALSGAKRVMGFAFLALCVAHGSFGPIFTHDIAASLFVVVLAIFSGCLEPEAKPPV